jgi:hypothetical protein
LHFDNFGWLRKNLGSGARFEYDIITFKTKPNNNIIAGDITNSESKFNIEFFIGIYNIYIESD